MPTLTAIFLTIASAFILLVAGLLGFTAWQTRRLEAEFLPSGQFVSVGDVRLHYTERRPSGPERATIILIHGASGNQADVMLPLGDRLSAKGYRVLAFDRPGLGYSTRPHGRADDAPSVQASLIRQAAEKLGVHRAIIVGHSLAGVLSTHFAIYHQDFTEGLVLLAPVTHPWPGGGVDWYYGMASGPFGWLFTHTVTLPMGLLTFDKALAGVFDPAPVPENYREKTGVALVLRPESFQANAQDVFDVYNVVLRQSQHLHEITAPTAILTGDSDGVVFASIHSVGSARDIPGATLEILPHIGHSPQWSAPDRVVQAIEDVMARAQAPQVAPLASPQAMQQHAAQ